MVRLIVVVAQTAPSRVNLRFNSRDGAIDSWSNSSVLDDRFLVSIPEMVRLIVPATPGAGSLFAVSIPEMVRLIVH